MSTYYLLNDTFIAVVCGNDIKVGNPKIFAMPCVHIEIQNDTAEPNLNDNSI